MPQRVVRRTLKLPAQLVSVPGQRDAKTGHGPKPAWSGCFRPEQGTGAAQNWWAVHPCRACTAWMRWAPRWENGLGTELLGSAQCPAHFAWDPLFTATHFTFQCPTWQWATTHTPALGSAVWSLSPGQALPLAVAHVNPIPSLPLEIPPFSSLWAWWAPGNDYAFSLGKSEADTRQLRTFMHMKFMAPKGFRWHNYK